MNESFLQLVRLGIGHPADSMPIEGSWGEFKILAEQHGLSAVVLDGVDYLRNSGHKGNLPDKELTLLWIGEVLQDYEQRYEKCCKTIGKLAKFYNDHGFKLWCSRGMD